MQILIDAEKGSCPKWHNSVQVYGLHTCLSHFPMFVICFLLMFSGTFLLQSVEMCDYLF
jgi:hypothetical protein